MLMYYRIRQNIRGGKLSRFINNLHYVGELSRFAALKPTRASAIRILECVQIRIKFDTRAGCMAEAEFETDSSVHGYHIYVSRQLDTCDWRTTSLRTVIIF